MAIFVTWKRLIDQSESPSGREGAIQSLKAISDFTISMQCRHVGLAAHFGEELGSPQCDACDVCLDDLDLVEQPLILAQKIISCVHRVDQNFGADYVSQVLTGSKDQRIIRNGHERLSTYGLLDSENKKDVRTWIEQLIGQGFLVKSGEYNVLQISEHGRELLRGESTPRLTCAAEPTGRISKSANPASWEGVDQDLFEKLRSLRGNEALNRKVPAYVVFGDASLRDMARRRPSTLEAFRMMHGVGKKKLDEFGVLFLDLIRQHCDSANLTTDVEPVRSTGEKKKPDATTPAAPSSSASASFEYFDQHLSIEDVAAKLGRATSTTRGYLLQYIHHKKVTEAERWVPAEIIDQIKSTIDQVGLNALKPIFVTLNETVSYDHISVVVACLKNVDSD